jgi:hypothetical protein
LQKALAIRRKLLGEEHPETAQSYSSFGFNWNSQGRFKEAEGSYQKALNVFRKLLGEEHPETATCYVGLAAAFHAQGR